MKMTNRYLWTRMTKLNKICIGGLNLKLSIISISIKEGRERATHLKMYIIIVRLLG